MTDLADRRLDGRVAIVTGGARGIGEATARLFAEHGASIAILDHDARAGERVAAELAKVAPCAFFGVDVALDPDVATGIHSVVDEFGGVDVLINNAAITLPKGFETTTPDEWDRVLNVNLKSVYLLMREAMPFLKKSQHGSVVNVSSFHASATHEDFSAYAASKAGVVGLTRSAALDAAPAGVRINALCPGIIATRMWEEWLAEVEDINDVRKQVLALQPLGRIGSPIDVAYAALFLASDESAYITGTTLFVDGGVSARLSHV